MAENSAASIPHVVILGAGFGGLNAARVLDGAPVRITVVDRSNHHLFQPLLYQVATAGLSAPNIAAPIRRILRKQRNVTVILAEAQAIDAANKRVILDHGELRYDYLIVGVGAVNFWFGKDEKWAPLAPGLKSIDEALEIRRRILLAFECAEREEDPVRKKAWLTFVVIGGGPTGTELAGSLTEVARHALRRDFRTFDPRSSRIVLLEGGDRVLAAFPPDLSQKAREQLEKLGVEVRTGAKVTDITDDGVQIGDDLLPAKTVLWGAGVKASPLLKTLGVELDRGGRVKVQPDLTAPGFPDVYVIGDAMYLEQDGKPVPGVAPAAIQSGKYAAKAILGRLKGRSPEPFRYFDKGSLATIGRRSAVAQFGSVRFAGFFAWILWLGVHVLFLIGFRNKAATMLEWTWAYFTYNRSARIILQNPLLDSGPERPAHLMARDRQVDPQSPPQPAPLPAGPAGVSQ